MDNANIFEYACGISHFRFVEKFKRVSLTLEPSIGLYRMKSVPKISRARSTANADDVNQQDKQMR